MATLQYPECIGTHPTAVPHEAFTCKEVSSQVCRESCEEEEVLRISKVTVNLSGHQVDSLLDLGQKFSGHEDRQMSTLRVKRSQLAVVLLLTQVASKSPVATDVNNNNTRNRRARLLVKGPN